MRPTMLTFEQRRRAIRRRAGGADLPGRIADQYGVVSRLSAAIGRRLRV
jgi:hypothetical protein